MEVEVTNIETAVLKTRLAPSPTGALHLGNARTFLVNWALARQNGWRILLRIDDLDGPRVKSQAAEEAIDILSWLGIDWDEGPTYQTQNLERYQAALRQLAAAGEIYPCRCTRSEIQAASRSAPHGDEHELRYPGTCRPAHRTTWPAEMLLDPELGWRFRVRPETVEFPDHVVGAVEINVDYTVGDFLISTKSCIPSYQLAVVIDDYDQQINRIVRGDDLLSSTARQCQIMDRLKLPHHAEYWHLPLVIGQDGRRLAKRHGDTRITSYREAGVRPERIIGLIARWCGMSSDCEFTAAEFRNQFRLELLPKGPIVFSEMDNEWLQSVAQ
jgi:glutamyl-tRNA synthetase